MHCIFYMCKVHWSCSYKLNNILLLYCSGRRRWKKADTFIWKTTFVAKSNVLLPLNCLLCFSLVLFLNFCGKVVVFLFFLPAKLKRSQLYILSFVWCWSGRLLRFLGAGPSKALIYPLIEPKAGWEGTFQEISCKQMPRSGAELERGRRWKPTCPNLYLHILPSSVPLLRLLFVLWSCLL